MKQRYLSIMYIFAALYAWLVNDVIERIPGPLTIVVSLIGIIVAGGMLILGGERNALNAMVRLLMLYVFVMALLLGANSFTIPDTEPVKKSPELSSPKLS